MIDSDLGTPVDKIEIYLEATCLAETSGVGAAKTTGVAENMDLAETPGVAEENEGDNTPN